MTLDCTTCARGSTGTAATATTTTRRTGGTTDAQTLTTAALTLALFGAGTAAANAAPTCTTNDSFTICEERTTTTKENPNQTKTRTDSQFSVTENSSGATIYERELRESTAVQSDGDTREKLRVTETDPNRTCTTTRQFSTTDGGTTVKKSEFKQNCK